MSEKSENQPLDSPNPNNGEAMDIEEPVNNAMAAIGEAVPGIDTAATQLPRRSQSTSNYPNVEYIDLTGEEVVEDERPPPPEVLPVTSNDIENVLNRFSDLLSDWDQLTRMFNPVIPIFQYHGYDTLFSARVDRASLIEAYNSVDTLLSASRTDQNKIEYGEGSMARDLPAEHQHWDTTYWHTERLLTTARRSLEKLLPEEYRYPDDNVFRRIGNRNLELRGGGDGNQGHEAISLASTVSLAEPQTARFSDPPLPIPRTPPRTLPQEPTQQLRDPEVKKLKLRVSELAKERSLLAAEKRDFNARLEAVKDEKDKEKRRWMNRGNIIKAKDTRIEKLRNEILALRRQLNVDGQNVESMMGEGTTAAEGNDFDMEDGNMAAGGAEDAPMDLGETTIGHDTVADGGEDEGEGEGADAEMW